MRSSTPRLRLTVRLLSLAIITLLATPLAGCWTPPVATVQPKGSPRVIQRAILVESEMRPAIVQAVDPRARTLVLQVAGGSAPQAYRADSRLHAFDHITAGQKVAVSFREELTIYVSPDGRAPAAEAGSQALVSNAKVLSIDPSYRLLTLEYPSGSTETVKVGREVELGSVAAGDDVSIQLLEVAALAARKPWWR